MANQLFVVRVAVHYVAEQSDPALLRYIFSYRITIENNSPYQVQLLRRKWLITNANDKKLKIEGEGVVGEQPFIDPGEQYSYSSGTMTDTPVSVMQGSYLMVDSNNHQFELDVAPFLLAVPNILH